MLLMYIDIQIPFIEIHKNRLEWKRYLSGVWCNAHVFWITMRSFTINSTSITTSKQSNLGCTFRTWLPKYSNNSVLQFTFDSLRYANILEDIEAICVAKWFFLNHLWKLIYGKCILHNVIAIWKTWVSASSKYVPHSHLNQFEFTLHMSHTPTIKCTSWEPHEFIKFIDC